VDIVPLLNAHAFLVVERPPEVWEVDGDDEPVVRMLGEMIAAALVRGTPLERVVLRAANVVVEVGSAMGPPGGAYVALSIMGPGDWLPEIHWRPDQDGAAVLVSPDLDAAARAAGARYGYTRSGAEGSVTVFLPRLEA
jgi:hypothetical protein